jgi:DNA mismatch repair protein MutS2
MAELPAFILPPRAARELGWRDVVAILEERCATPFGAEALAREPFPRTRAGVNARTEDVLESAHLVEQRTLPDFASMEDLRPWLDLVEKDAALSPAELSAVARTVAAIARVRDLVESRADEVPRLLERVAALVDEREWAQRVLRSFDDGGRITDEASPRLREVRERVRSLRADASSKLESIIRGYDGTEILRERNFTVRNDRYVLPVRAEHQAKVDGIVHDASQTGQTVYVEPQALLELGNRIKIAQAAVIEEEQRILHELSQEVKQRASTLRAQLRHAGEIDALFARGAFAAAIGAGRVEILDEGAGAGFELRRARHPLLAWARHAALADGQPADDVVANDIGLGGRRALVITGPNAGGKTVALKTVGLCAALARAGMPLPVAPDSKMPLCTAVFSTIGDQQSLEDALSSFSGHLEALRDILEQTAAHARRGPALCLLDELAAGTDPAQGAAIAQSVLEELVDEGAHIVARTHFERLKLLGLAEREDNPFRNASLALDGQTRVVTACPGASSSAPRRCSPPRRRA